MRHVKRRDTKELNAMSLSLLGIFGLAVASSIHPLLAPTTPTIPTMLHPTSINQAVVSPPLVQPPPVTDAPTVYQVSSTSYCTTGITASGVWTETGMVANNMFPFGTQLLILSGTHQGEVVTVTDRIGAYSQLDFYTPYCSVAWVYGRQTITFEVVNSNA
jgi:hypothetical protein